MVRFNEGVTTFSTLDDIGDDSKVAATTTSTTNNNNHSSSLATRRRSSIYLTTSNPLSSPTSSTHNDGGWVIEGVRAIDENDDNDIEVSIMSNAVESSTTNSTPPATANSRRDSIVSPTPVVNKIVNNTQSIVGNTEPSNTITTNLNNAIINTINVPMTFSIDSNPGSVFNGLSVRDSSVVDEVSQTTVKKPHLKDISKADTDHRQSFYVYHYDYRPSATGDGKAVSTSIRNIKKKNQTEEKAISVDAFKSFFTKSHPEDTIDKEKILSTMIQNSGSSMVVEHGSKVDSQNEMQNIPKTFQPIKKASKPMPIQEGLPLISLKLTFSFLVSILIVFACVGIFISVFVPLYVSIDDLTYKNIQTIHKQINVHLDKILETLERASLLGADHYNSGFITRPMFREYLLSAYRRTGVFVGYFFSNPPLSERFSYTVMSPGNRLYYTRQEDGFPGIIRDRVDINGTVIQYNATVDNTPAVLATTDFYRNTISNIDKLKSEGAFSSPFYIINGSIAFPFATLLYDPIKLKTTGTKVIQGICRCTIPLILFSDFLKDVKVMENGYTILTEMSGPTTIAGSIKTTSEDGKKALSVFDLTDKKAGLLMRAIALSHDFYNLPSFFSISSEGISYLVSVSSYSNENISWRQFVIVYADDITKTAQNSIIAAICVAFGILILSIVYGFLIGRIALRPILFLEKQLALIQVFDLKNVRNKNSFFKEINSIYESLAATVQCLLEIKSFLPDTVVNQLDEIEKNERQLIDTTLGKSLNPSSSMEKYSIDKSINQSFQTSNIDTRSNPSSLIRSNSRANNYIRSSLVSKGSASSLFKMGLTKKECSVLNISLPQYSDMHTPEEVSTTFPKIVSVIRSAAQHYQANLQVVSISEFLLVFDIGTQHKHISLIAMECALKVKRGLEALNTQQDMSSEKVESFKFSMGISTNENCFVGNLGSKTFRYYSIISESTVIAKNLSFLANQLKINILVDERTFKESSKYFITRPVERLLFRTIRKQILDNDEEYIKSQLTTIDTVSSVYELMRESAIEENECKYIY